MKNKLGTFFIIFGALLIAAAAVLLVYNRNEDKQAGEAAGNTLPQIVDVIKENIEQQNQQSQQQGSTDRPVVRPKPHPNSFNEQEVQLSYEMKAVEIDGHEYIGYISIPKIKIDLPVMSAWSYPNLKIAPCRQFGTIKGKDLVIVGHNYARHLGYIYKLRAGDTLQFTDMDGNVTNYSVLGIEQLAATDVEQMKAGSWDLTLYTCTYGGRNRIAVRFRMTEP